MLATSTACWMSWRTPVRLSVMGSVGPKSLCGKRNAKERWRTSRTAGRADATQGASLALAGVGLGIPLQLQRPGWGPRASETGVAFRRAGGWRYPGKIRVVPPPGLSTRRADAVFGIRAEVVLLVDARVIARRVSLLGPFLPEFGALLFLHGPDFKAPCFAAGKAPFRSPASTAT